MAESGREGRPTRVIAEHDYQIVVYSGGEVASVDDLWINRSVSLDPRTMQPVHPDPALPTHDSFTLRRVDGRWLVDEGVRIGVGRQMPDGLFSAAAATRGARLPPALREEVERAYLDYWSAHAKALRELDPTPYESVMTGDVLDLARRAIQDRRSQNQPVGIGVEHNLRIAAAATTTLAFVYDTYLERSQPLDPATLRPTGAEAWGVYRNGFVLKKAEAQWGIVYVQGYSPPD